MTVLQQLQVGTLRIEFAPEDRSTAEVMAEACSEALPLAKASWGLDPPADCRLYVMTSWRDFVFRSAPWPWSRLLSARPGDITLHTLDLDLLLVDHASPTTQGVQARSPVCFVTQGLIRESMLWATGQRPDVEETSCKARGEGACEFKITVQK